MKAADQKPSTICGARLSGGTVCKAIPFDGRTRCHRHGGASTGPKTAEGRKRFSAAQISRWETITAALNAWGDVIPGCDPR